MTGNIDVRESGAGDLGAIEILYQAAFPDEDLLPLVRELLKGRADILSLVATVSASLAGHAAFTTGAVEETAEKAALLGPLAVAPGRQRQGIGSALVRAGLLRLEKTGVRHVCVLGDPAYYGRFGFTPGTRIAPPYALPAEWRDAWQSTSLGDAEPPAPATLSLPDPWRRPALWRP